MHDPAHENWADVERRLARLEHQMEQLLAEVQCLARLSTAQRHHLPQLSPRTRLEQLPEIFIG